MFTSETAKEMGRKGGLTSGATRRNAETRARARLAREAPALAEELLRAAKGEPPFNELDPKDRLNAILRALEHGIGRPPTRQTVIEKEAKEAPGLVLALGGEE